MNAPHPLHQLNVSSAAFPSVPEDDDEISFREYWDIVIDNRWLIAAVALTAFTVGGAYAFLAKPVYEASLLIQVEDSNPGKSFLGEAAGLLDIKAPATAEMEILRSRMVIGEAVSNTRLYIDAAPRYLPLVGHWLAVRSADLSEPGVLGLGGWVTGAEKITVTEFQVPPSFEGTVFRVTASGGSSFSLSHPNLDSVASGSVGSPLVMHTPDGDVRLVISELAGKAGAEFELSRLSEIDVIDWLQEKLKLSEKGRQSGVIEASLRDTDRYRLTSVLNEIGKQYVRQNVERKAAEAQKTLAFLDLQVPQFRKQLNESEEAYNRYRYRQGTVSLDEEAKLMLTRSVELQGRLVEARQKRLELVSRFTPEHPNIVTLDSQIATWKEELDRLELRIKSLPSVQQDALRLERDVKVNNGLYEQLRSNTLQLQLIREGKIGNVRVIDLAYVPKKPVQPRKALTLAIAGLLGIIGGILLSFARNAFFRGIRSAQEIEVNAGLNVYSTIPLSKGQQQMARRVTERSPGVHILAQAVPHDPAIESLRSLRAALQFAMLDAASNRVLITGATPAVGKSFVSANFAAILASAGKRVLLIDADLRKGHLNHYFGVDRQLGLSEVVAGSVGISDAIRKNVLPNLDFLPTGVLPPNPSELVVSGAFVTLLEHVSSRYDLVLIDSAPILVAADTVSVSLHSGPILLVARAEQTQMGEIHESVRRLANAGRSIAGVLFNALDVSRRHFGSYSYRYGAYQYQDYNYAPTDDRS